MCKCLCFFQTDLGYVRSFAGLGIFAGCLAQIGGASGNVQQIVDQLECHAEVLPVFAYQGELFAVPAAADSAHHGCGANNRSCFSSVDIIQPFRGVRHGAEIHIRYLSGDHACRRSRRQSQKPA